MRLLSLNAVHATQTCFTSGVFLGIWAGGIVFFFPPSPTLASLTLWLMQLLLNPRWFILLFPHRVGIHPSWVMSSDLPILECPITCLPVGQWGTDHFQTALGCGA